MVTFSDPGWEEKDVDRAIKIVVGLALTAIMVLVILLLCSCTHPDCDCGVITGTGTTSLGNTKVQLQTDCESDWYLIYDTTRTWKLGDPACIDDFGHTLNLIIHKAYIDWQAAFDSGYTDDSFAEWMDNDSGNDVYELNDMKNNCEILDQWSLPDSANLVIKGNFEDCDHLTGSPIMEFKLTDEQATEVFRNCKTSKENELKNMEP